MAKRFSVTEYQVARELAKNVRIPYTLAIKMVAGTLSIVASHLSKLHRCELRRLGVFRHVVYQQRLARNPKTDERVVIPAHVRISFRPNRTLRMTVANRQPEGESAGT